MLYTVTWRIGIKAETPEAAAEEAREIQLDFETDAVFFVKESGGKKKGKSITVIQE